MSGSFTNLVSQAGGVTGALPPAAEPGCCFTVYKKPATFKVDAFALITLKTRTDFPGLITEEGICYHAFTKRGWKWGGTWKNVKDYQHFCKQEIIPDYFNN